MRFDGQAAMLTKVLKPETEGDLSAGPTEHGEFTRSGMSVRDEAGELVIDIRAEDVVALRAALNSYLRWTKLALDAKDAIEVRE
jgi:hypothetical protein